MPHPHNVRYCLKMAAIFVALLLPLTGRGQTLITSDSLLNTGSPLSQTYTAPGTSGPNGPINLSSDSSVNLWLMYPDPFGINSGSGTIVQNYTGSGSVTESISLSGLPGSGVDAFPFILYGCDPFSDCYNGQPPQFPKQLSAMSSLVVDFNYGLSGTITGRDVDLLFDEWVCNSNHPTDSSQCLEIEVLPYYSFVDFGGGSFIKTINESATLNGSTSTFSFDEYKGGTNILFYPHTMPGLSSGHLRFDLLDFLKEGVTTWGDSSYQYISGIELGTEFGASSSQSYTLTLTRLDIEQTSAGSPPAPPPAPPTNLTGIVK